MKIKDVRSLNVLYEVSSPESIVFFQILIPSGSAFCSTNMEMMPNFTQEEIGLTKTWPFVSACTSTKTGCVSGGFMVRSFIGLAASEGSDISCQSPTFFILSTSVCMASALFLDSLLRREFLETVPPRDSKPL